MKKKLKVVWICHFDYSRFKERLQFHSPPVEVIAPWITLLSEIFEKHTNEIDLNIISSPPQLKKDIKITDKGIHYYFISNKLPFINHKMPFIVKKVIRYRNTRRKVNKIVRSINPSIVEFHGAEHDLAFSILDLEFPKILTPQFFVNNYYKFRPTKYLKYWMEIENELYEKCRFISYRNDHMKREILSLNKNAKLFKYQYPIKKPSISAKDYKKKEADIIFTARLINSKGIEDLLQVLFLIKKEIPNIKAKIIGQCNEDYKKILDDMVVDLGLRENVAFLGYLPTQENVFFEVAKSKMSVLPTHFDLIPGTVIEAMFIGTPVVAYSVGGLSELNANAETIKLVEPGNINHLKEEIIALLHDPKKINLLVSKALDNVNKRFNNEEIYNDMIKSYLSVIDETTISQNN